MEYTKGDLVLVQTSYENKENRPQYAIVQNETFNAIKVKFMQCGTVKVYLKRFITPVMPLYRRSYESR